MSTSKHQDAFGDNKQIQFTFIPVQKLLKKEQKPEYL